MSVSTDKYLVDLSDVPFPTDFRSLVEGVWPSAVDALVDQGFMSRADLRRMVPTRTLERRRVEHKRLTVQGGDGIVRLLRTRAHAVRVFGGTDLADEWLHAPNPSLGGERSIDMALTDVGAHEVEGVLGRLEHGVLA